MCIRDRIATGFTFIMFAGDISPDHCDLRRIVENPIESQTTDITQLVSGWTLREILDVDSNLPVWVEDIIAKVIEEADQLAPAEKAKLIMKQLDQLGIADAIAEYTRSVPDAKTD